MDRNADGVVSGSADYVALRKESVDRNPKLYQALSHVRWSLSARRAWIEMAVSAVLQLIPLVALRKESVDRNSCVWHQP